MADPFVIKTADPAFDPSRPVTINGYRYEPVRAGVDPASMSTETLRELVAKATPGPWETEEDPTQNGDHETLVTLPGRAGVMGTWLACTLHNWNDAVAGEHRISWKEAESNAALIVHLVNSIPEIIAMMEREEARETELAAVKAERDGLREAIKGLLAVNDMQGTTMPAGDRVNAWASAILVANRALKGTVG